jgi:hypothetical protein
LKNQRIKNGIIFLDSLKNYLKTNHDLIQNEIKNKYNLDIPKVYITNTSKYGVIFESDYATISNFELDIDFEDNSIHIELSPSFEIYRLSSSL